MIFGQQYLTAENLQWLSSLSSLQHLDMSDVNLTKANDWLQVTNMLPSLVELHLSDCDLMSSDIPQESILNFTSLRVLDISYNYLSSFLIPWWLSSLRGLVSLKINGCFFGADS